jgi:hypothetical protein
VLVVGFIVYVLFYLCAHFCVCMLVLPCSALPPLSPHATLMCSTVLPSPTPSLSHFLVHSSYTPQNMLPISPSALVHPRACAPPHVHHPCIATGALPNGYQRDGAAEPGR